MGAKNRPIINRAGPLKKLIGSHLNIDREEGITDIHAVDRIKKYQIIYFVYY